MLLLIPGPVTTRPEVRAALAADIAPWDLSFRAIYAGIRERLLRLAGGVAGEHTVLPIPGCGHFANEAAMRAFLPPGGRILIPLTGGYASQLVRLARGAGREPVPLEVVQTEPIPPERIGAALDADPTITHAGLVQSETASGVVHDIDAIGAVVRGRGRRMLVDSVSAFGALPLDMAAHPEIDAACFTPNKCLEAFPGAAFAVCRTDRLDAAKGNAGSFSLDLADIRRQFGTHDHGSARFTPPVQVLNALNRALDFHDAEGGCAARLVRYTSNMRVLYDGLVDLGLTPFVTPEHQGPIIVTVRAPNDPAWDLQRFVDALKARGVLISNFFSMPTPGFRVGCIGAIGPAEMAGAVAAMDRALNDIGIKQRAGESP